MPRRLAFAPVLVLLVSMLAGPGASAGSAAPGCVEGTAGEAAAELVHHGAEVSQVGHVAGFRSALALEPIVYPGVRHRLIRAGGLWCDASAFNRAWQLAGRDRDALAMASAYVQIAPAAFFDQVTVRSAKLSAPGVVALETHARTNGITASWVVAMDAQGVRHAAWTATGLGVEPFVGEIEGVSALPGLRRTYARGADGSVTLVEALFAEADADAEEPVAVTEGTTADGMTLRVMYGDAGPSPNLGMDTGVDPVDRPRILLKMLLDNYQEFHDWGLRKGWTSDVGILYVDDAISAYCWACVYIREDFQIHITSALTQILFAVGFEYPDDRKALDTIMGHEMAHNFQNAYTKPEQNDAFTSDAFSEGIARFQETLHDYSEVSHQPKSLLYSLGRVPGYEANSCNGWFEGAEGDDMSATFARGPFTGMTYNACYFWLSWYPQHGTAGIVDLFTAMKDHVTKAGHAEVIAGLKQATGDTLADDLAAFAQASITGEGYTWAAPGSDEPGLDWGQYLDRWTPAEMTTTQVRQTISNGGVMARELTSGGTISWASSSPSRPASVYVIRDDGTTATRTRLDETDEVPDVVEAPADGERVWLVAVLPYIGTSAVTLAVT